MVYEIVELTKTGVILVLIKLIVVLETLSQECLDNYYSLVIHHIKGEPTSKKNEKLTQ